jgi:hypothetical protein
VLVVVGVLCMGPGRCQSSAEGFFSGDPAPDVRGDWNVEYDDSMTVEFEIDGAVYTGSIGGATSSVTFDHDGESYEFDIDCERAGVICPSEVFPNRISLEQRNFADQPHQVHMTISEAECRGTMVDPREGEDCGGDTGIDCADVEQVCDGVMIERTSQELGSISNPEPAEPEVGSQPAYTIGISLGGGVAIAGNCVVITAASAVADLQYDGTYDPEANSMAATEMTNGEITTTFGAGCFFVEGAGGMGVGAVSGAQIRLTTGFTATKARF